MPDFPAWNLFSHFFPLTPISLFSTHFYASAQEGKFSAWKWRREGIEIWNSDFLSFSFFFWGNGRSPSSAEEEEALFFPWVPDSSSTWNIHLFSSGKRKGGNGLPLDSLGISFFFLLGNMRVCDCRGCPKQLYFRPFLIFFSSLPKHESWRFFLKKVKCTFISRNTEQISMPRTFNECISDFAFLVLENSSPQHHPWFSFPLCPT